MDRKSTAGREFKREEERGMEIGRIWLEDYNIKGLIT